MLEDALRWVRELVASLRHLSCWHRTRHAAMAVTYRHCGPPWVSAEDQSICIATGVCPGCKLRLRAVVYYSDDPTDTASRYYARDCADMAAGRALYKARSNWWLREPRS